MLLGGAGEADGEKTVPPKGNVPRRQRQRRPLAIRVSITLMATM